MDNKKNTRTIGEIVEVNTLSFTAHCLPDPRPSTPCLYDPPPFGSFVKISPPGRNAEAEAQAGEEADPFASLSYAGPAGDPILAPHTTFAVVCLQRMGSLDPSRRPSALGYPDSDSLLAHQPQLAELIATEFCGLLLAHTNGEGRLRRYLPARPPQVHSRVAECDKTEVRALTGDLSFLRSLLGPSLAGLPAPQDELTAAVLRSALEAQDGNQAYLVEAGKKLLEVLADDYERFRAIMDGVL